MTTTTPPDGGLCLRHYPASPAAPDTVRVQTIEERAEGKRVAPVAHEPAAAVALEALTAAQNGLAWYRDQCPAVVNGSDDEADELIARAIAGLAAPVAAQSQPDASIHLQDLRKEVAATRELRQQLNLMEEHARGECWRWHGDGTDDLASMGNRMGVLIYACDLRNLLAAQQPVSGADGLPIELRGISETAAKGAGVWRSCSGCHELNEGHDTGPRSKVFGCALGVGCSECGGIGAVWDTTDYGAMGDALAASMAQPQPSGNAGELDERAAFEAWATGFMGWDTTPNDSCGYRDSRVTAAWCAWGSYARAALAAQPSAPAHPAEGVPATGHDALDAERYRLLRRGQKWSVIDGAGETLRADELDAAVDAARQGEGGAN